MDPIHGIPGEAEPLPEGDADVEIDESYTDEDDVSEDIDEEAEDA